MVAGVSPGAWWYWDAFNANATVYREVYLSFWAKIPTADFENQAVYTKLIYFAHGGDGTGQKNNDVIALKNGTGSRAMMSSMEIVFSTSTADDRTGDNGSAPRYQNINTTKKFTTGAWHQVEVYAKVGTVDNYDGVKRVWIDGVLVTEYTNVKFLDSRYNFVRGFYEAQWTPVWGGTGGTKTRDDFMLLDHVYVSRRLWRRLFTGWKRPPKVGLLL
jgi:hypothetical protein